MDLIEKIRKRIPEDTVRDGLLLEYIQTVSDRLCLRLGEDHLPSIFQSICVDAVVKMYRRTYYEGISSEGTSNLTTSFVDDILDEYSDEITSWKLRKTNISGSGRVVRFL